jgi:diguanylate cyclase (GGDEF)-like protein
MTARFYAGGALVAACGVAAASFLSWSVQWLVPLTGITLLLAHLWYVRRLEDERRHGQQVAERHLATMEALAMSIGPLPPDELHKLRMHPEFGDEIIRAVREIYSLYQIAQAMGTKLGVPDTMAIIASRLSNLVPFSACALFLCSDTTDQLICRFATGTDWELMKQMSLRQGQGLAGWVARNRRPLINALPSTDLEATGLGQAGLLQSALVCPLLLGDRLIGTLAVYHTDPSFYKDDHCRLLNRVCEQAAAVISNAAVFEQTQEDSLTDPLTGLPNARALFQCLSRELARAVRVKSDVAVIVMDVNDFKDINDSYGHHVGDRTLREVGRVLRSGIRTYDMCVRYAGDEFVAVLSGCSREEAEAKRQELQEAVAGIALEPRAGRSLTLSISAGVAVFPLDGDSHEALLAAADHRMYLDKGARKMDAGARLAAPA